MLVPINQRRMKQCRREAYIFDPVKQGISTASSPSDMFSTHPGILKRLAAIGIRRKSNS